MQIDGLKGIRWIRGLGGEKLPAASYALLPKPEKRSMPSQRDRDFLSPVFYHTQQRPNVFVSDAWPGFATYHWSFREHGDQTVGRGP